MKSDLTMHDYCIVVARLNKIKSICSILQYSGTSPIRPATRLGKSDLNGEGAKVLFFALWNTIWD